MAVFHRIFVIDSGRAIDLTCRSRQFKAMRFLIVTLAAAIIAVFYPGCVLSAPSTMTYRAKIVRVQEREGDFISPQKGHRPLFCLSLRVSDPRRKGREESLQVLVLDSYSPRVYGKAGDTVSFNYRDRLPSSGEIDLESLGAYEILPKEGAPDI
jgi:hypothetical protein